MFKTNLTTSKTLISLAVGSALISSSAFAEEASQLEEITITETIKEGIDADDSTATKMNLSLKDTARSVTKVSATEISDTAAKDIQEVADYQTGFKWEESSSRYIYNRGIQTKLSAFTINGQRTLSGSGSSSVPSTYNLESVTFLNGADSILYGTGIAGGTINATTKTPQEESKTTLGFSTRSYAAGDVGYFDQNQLRFNLDSTGSLDKEGDILYRFITQQTPHGESYQDGHAEDSGYIDASLSFKVGDNTTITTRFEYKNEENEGSNLTSGSFGDNFSNGTLDVTTNSLGEISDRSLSYGSPLDKTTFKSKTAEISIEHILNRDWLINARATIVESEQQTQALYISDSAALGNSVGDTYLQRKWFYGETYNTFYAFDMNTQGTFTIADVDNHLIAGINIGQTDIKTDSNYQSSTDALDQYVININDPDDQTYSDVPDSLTEMDFKITREREINLYLKDRISISDWTFALGLGYLSYHGEESDGTYSRNDSNLAFDTAAIYKIDENMNLFASYSQTYDPIDTSNVVQYGQDGVDYEPEESDNYEFGIKGNFFNNTLNASINLFYINTKNETYTEGSGTDKILYQTLGENFRSHGVEVSALYYFTEQFSTQLNYTYTDAHDTSGDDAGDQSDATPYNALTIWNSYSLANQPIRFALGMRAESSSIKQTTKLDNYDHIYYPGYAEFDFGTYYETAKWDLSFTIKNLLDENRAATTANWLTVAASDPRSFNLNFNYKL